MGSDFSLTARVKIGKKLELLGEFRGKRKRKELSHVLWYGGMGSMADSGANRVPPMPILPDARGILDNSGWHSCFEDEPCVFLRLCDG